MKNAYFAGGCFWCITPAFSMMEGVASVTAGFSGGTEVDPTYEDVKCQRTGHRETICVAYDSAKVSFDVLLEIFLNGVDLFDEGGQFIDRGRSYTLAVYYQNEEEKSVTLRRLHEIEAHVSRRTYVAVEPFLSFYPAGEEHQEYFKRNPEAFEIELEESGRIEYFSNKK